MDDVTEDLTFVGSFTVRKEESMMTARLSAVISQWVSQAYPDYPYMYWGQSGMSLLFDVLRQERRKKIVLPAFICPGLPAMADAAGMKVVLVDVNPETLHMGREQLEQCLADDRDEETILLVDHSFGYPFAALSEVRCRHPKLLIIEDCVRALGSRINERPVGHTGDWTLLSMYKTTPGNNHGAILLTRSPYRLRTGPPPPTTWRQWASTSRPLRLLHERVNRNRPDFGPTRREVESLSWLPEVGIPNLLCIDRFGESIGRLSEDLERRRKTAAAIQDALTGIEGFRFVLPSAGCDTAAYYLTFTVAPSVDRNRLLTALHRRGLFLQRTWDSVPAFYKIFRGAFLFGFAGSVFLADHVGHIPVVRFTTPGRLTRLVGSLRELMSMRTAS